MERSSQTRVVACVCVVFIVFQHCVQQTMGIILSKPIFNIALFYSKMHFSLKMHFSTQNALFYSKMHFFTQNALFFL